MCRILSHCLEWEAQVCVWGEREAEGVAGPHLPQQAPRTCRLPIYFHWEMRWLSRGSDTDPRPSAPWLRAAWDHRVPLCEPQVLLPAVATRGE